MNNVSNSHTISIITSIQGAVRLSWLDNDYSRPLLLADDFDTLSRSDRPGFLACNQGSLVGLCTQDYKSLCAAVMMSGALVNIQTHRQTAFWPAYMNSSASWASNSSRFETRGLSRLFDQGGMVAMSGQQTKPIFQMCHCTPTYNILHCDVRYQYDNFWQGGVSTAWLAGVEFWQGGYTPLWGGMINHCLRQTDRQVWWLESQWQVDTVWWFPLLTMSCHDNQCQQQQQPTEDKDHHSHHGVESVCCLYKTRALSASPHC